MSAVTVWWDAAITSDNFAYVLMKTQSGIAIIMHAEK